MIIYLIRNIKNNKSYVGLDRTEMGRRWKEHQRQSRSQNPKQLIDRKIKEYGLHNFEYIVLQMCNDVASLKEWEIHYIRLFNTFVEDKHGYNLTRGGEGCFGYKMPEEKINKGAKHYKYGKKWDAETNAKRSATMKKVRATTTNPFTTPAVRKKISEHAKKRTGKSNPNYRHGNRIRGN